MDANFSVRIGGFKILMREFARCSPKPVLFSSVIHYAIHYPYLTLNTGCD